MIDLSRLFLCALFVLGLALPAPAQEKADERVAPGANAPGGKVLEWTSREGKPYWYRVPERIDARRPPNLLFMLHGTGMPWGWAFWNYPIAIGRFRGGDIVVAPEGMTPGHGDTFNFLQGNTDGDQLVGLIQTFREAYPIGNVYLYGHSQGAFFCYWFAGEHPDLVDGIVAHAGNVLDVKHSKLAKEKVAIGILHGRADAVVPVECAIETEKIYRAEGYRHIKLYVVEGLTETSGHWPLPEQVGEMLEWLDQVCTKSAGQALRVAVEELRQESPELGVVSGAVGQAETLARKEKGEGAAALAARLALLGSWLDGVGAALAAELLAAPEATQRGLPFGAWVGEFLATEAALGARAAWQTPAKALRSASEQHGKRVEKLLAKADRADKGLFADGLEALRESYLAPRIGELQALLLRLAESPPKGVAVEDVAALRALVAEREEAWKTGRERARALVARQAAELRTAHPELFEGE